jgi:plasmid stabilization system protein ParE
MRIVYKQSFIDRLENQLEYISLDSPSRARKFKNELLKRIAKAKRNPRQFRKSGYFDDPNIRDLILKVIPSFFVLIKIQLKYSVS